MRCFCLRFSKHWTGMSPAGPIFFAAETLQPKPSEAIGLALLEKADVALQNERGQTILFEAQLRSAEYTQTLLSKFPINIAARCVRQVFYRVIMSCAHGSSYLASQYENVRKQARSMKESYEERVRTLEAEVAQLTETNDRSLAKAREVATALQRQVREARQEGEAKVQQVREEQDGDSKQELDAEVSIGLRYDVTEEGRIHEIPVHCCR